MFAGAAGKPVSILRRTGASSASLATSASAGALADADGAAGADDGASEVAVTLWWWHVPASPSPAFHPPALVAARWFVHL